MKSCDVDFIMFTFFPKHTTSMQKIIFLASFLVTFQFQARSFHPLRQRITTVHPKYSCSSLFCNRQYLSSPDKTSDNAEASDFKYVGDNATAIIQCSQTVKDEDYSDNIGTAIDLTDEPAIYFGKLELSRDDEYEYNDLLHFVPRGESGNLSSKDAIAAIILHDKKIVSPASKGSKEIAHVDTAPTVSSPAILKADQTDLSNANFESARFQQIDTSLIPLVSTSINSTLPTMMTEKISASDNSPVSLSQSSASPTDMSRLPDSNNENILYKVNNNSSKSSSSNSGKLGDSITTSPSNSGKLGESSSTDYMPLYERIRSGTPGKILNSKLLSIGRLFKLSFNAALAYSLVANTCAITCLIISWVMHGRTTGLSPVAPGQWKSFLDVYASLWARSHLLRPIRLALAVVMTPAFEALTNNVVARTGFKRPTGE